LQVTMQPHGTSLREFAGAAAMARLPEVWFRRHARASLQRTSHVPAWQTDCSYDMQMVTHWRRFGCLALVAVALSGCATGTMTARFGPLPDGGSLVTLIVSEDVAVVRQECATVGAHGNVLGCQSSRPVRGPGPLPVRAMKIVRYAESLPSPMTFEIDAHELCHAIAVLQLLDDPCHHGNNGMLTSSR
jgi:hypothetical protein